jgi:hypothetical protein
VDLRTAIQTAKARLHRAIEALAPKHQGGEVEEWRAAHENLLRLERELAKSEDRPYAESISFPVPWDTGAPLPHVIASETAVAVVFYARRDDPDWDGTYTSVHDSHDPVGVVEFRGVDSHPFGTPNDEVLSGHPLYGSGLEGYAAQVVRNSPWLEEVRRINQVHPQYSAQRWLDIRHFVLWFHDTTFECLASSFTVELHPGSMRDAILATTARLAVVQ